MKGRCERRSKQLLNDIKENIGCRKLGVETIDRSLWRTRFGRGFRPVPRQANERTNELSFFFTLLQMNLILVCKCLM